jgi:hypothetical protein
MLESDNVAVFLRNSRGSGVSPEDLVHALDCHGALAHCSGTAFHRTGAHVTGSKNPRPTRLQRPRQTARAFPRGCVGNRVAGFYEALLIALDFRRQPA